MNEGWLFITVVLAEALLHYIRWTEILMGRKLHQVIAYALGVLAMMVPFTFWLIGSEHYSNETIAWVLWKTIVSGGVSVVLCYGFDAVVDLLWHDKHQTAENALLKGRANDDKA
jgi:hypothetical protein